MEIGSCGRCRGSQDKEGEVCSRNRRTERQKGVDEETKDGKLGKSRSRDAEMSRS